MSAPRHREPTAEAPQGWTATQLSDETVRLRRSRFDCTDNSAVWFFPALVVLLTLLATGPGSALYATHPWLVWVLGATLVPASVVGTVAWMLSGVEDWHLRPGSLEIRKRILGRQQAKRYSDVELRFRQVHRRGRTAEHRPWQLLAIQSGRSSVLCESSWRGTAGALDLGRYVAAATGWPFQTSPDEPVTDGFTRFGE